MMAGVDAELRGVRARSEQGAEAGRRRPLRSRAAVRRGGVLLPARGRAAVLRHLGPERRARRSIRSGSARRAARATRQRAGAKCRLQAAGGATRARRARHRRSASARSGACSERALAGVATLVVAIFGGWFVAGRALAPIKRISQTARAMSEGDLNARIAVEQHRERARAGGVDAERRVRSSAAGRGAGAPVHGRCVARASHADLGAARRNGVGARSRAEPATVQGRADGVPARGAPHAGHRRAAARARAGRSRARCARACAGRDAHAHRRCRGVARAHGAGARRSFERRAAIRSR